MSLNPVQTAADQTPLPARFPLRPFLNTSPHKHAENGAFYEPRFACSWKLNFELRELGPLHICRANKLELLTSLLTFSSEDFDTPRFLKATLHLEPPARFTKPKHIAFQCIDLRWAKVLPVSFLPCCMECRRGLAMRKLSVCLSVRPSNAWIVTKTEERSVQIFIPYERSFSLVLWEKKCWWGRPLLPESLI